MNPVLRLAGCLALFLVWVVPSEHIRAQDRPTRLHGRGLGDVRGRGARPGLAPGVLPAAAVVARPLRVLADGGLRPPAFWRGCEGMQGLTARRGGQPARLLIVQEPLPEDAKWRAAYDR